MAVDPRAKGARAETLIRDQLRALTNLQWERVGSMDDFGGETTITAARAKVLGGWLIKITDATERFHITFLPDPNHEWK